MTSFGCKKMADIPRSLRRVRTNPANFFFTRSLQIPLASMCGVYIYIIYVKMVDVQPVSNNVQWRNFIIWIEDQKIRFYTIQDREGLRKSTGEQWNKANEKYLKDIGCPYSGSTDRVVIADWLLSHAVRLEYGEQVEKYKAASAESIRRGATDTDPFEHLRPDDSNFKAGLASICRLLNMPEHFDQEVTLRGVSILINQRLSKEALEDASIANQEGVSISLEDCPLGFNTDDRNLNEAAKILRLLHVNELRELQTRINEAIVSAQGVTANPRTDERLGKVGRM